MKKVLTVLFALLLTCDSTFAATIVARYNNAGRVTGYRYGAGIHQKFGRNAIYAPHTARRISQINRQRKLENAIINSINNRGRCCNNNMPMLTNGASMAAAPTSAPMSRFDKNYTIKTPKTRTVGGVTYYN